MLRSMIAVAAAFVVLAVSAMDAEALNRRPTVGDIDRCELDSFGGGSDQGCEGLICWCCYSDGCFICNYVATVGGDTDCVWDPSYAGGQRPGGFSQQFQMFELLEQADPGMTFQPPATSLPPTTGPLDGGMEQ